MIKINILTVRKIRSILCIACVFVELFFLISPKTLFAAEQKVSNGIVSQTTTPSLLTQDMSNAISPSTQNELSEKIPSTQPNGFSHLYVFSIGGLVVLVLLWTGLAAGPVWFLIFALNIYTWGWLSIPWKIETLPIKKIILYFILLKIAMYILGFTLNSLIKGEKGEDIKFFLTSFSTDLILIVPIIWLVVSGVFIYTPMIGRWLVIVLLICLAIAGRIPIKLASMTMTLSKRLGCSLGCLPLLRPLYVFFSLWIMSVWL